MKPKPIPTSLSSRLRAIGNADVQSSFCECHRQIFWRRIFRFVLMCVIGFVAGFLGYLSALSYFPSRIPPQNLNTPFEKISSGTVQVTSLFPQNLPEFLSRLDTLSIPVFYQRSSVVNAGDLYYDSERLGTAISLTSDGWLLALKSLLELSLELVAVTSDRQVHSLEYVLTDPLTGMAFFRMKNASGLQASEFVRMEDLQIGMPLYTALPRLDQIPSFDVTYMSQLGGSRSDDRKTLVQSSETIYDFIYTTDVLQGDAFAPVFTEDGKIAGFLMPQVNRDQNFSHVLPAHFIAPLLLQVLKDGSIARPYLGVQYIHFSNTVTSPGIPNSQKGMLLFSRENQPAVLPDSPAEKAGLREGDILVQLQTLSLENSRALSTLLMDYKPGDVIDFVVVRNGEQITLSVTLGILSSP